MDFVHRCPCLLCSGAFYMNSPRIIAAELIQHQQRKAITDSHHLPSLLGYRRRTFDLLTVPLCRLHHGWMDTVQGKAWEKDHLPLLIRVAIELAYRNGRISEHALMFTRKVEDESLAGAAELVYQAALEGVGRESSETEKTPPSRDGKNRSRSQKIKGAKLPKGRKFPKGRKL